MHALIIHMSSSTARRPNAEALLRTLPDPMLIEAVDGRDPAQVTGVMIRPGDAFSPAYPFALAPGEIGCFLSHRRCWRRILAEGWDHALIVEDDLAIDPARFTAALDLIADHVTPDSYIRLPVKPRERAAQILGHRDGLDLILPRKIGLQTVAQVVGRGAAARLLDATQILDRPVDTLLQMHWVTGQPIHSLTGSGVRELTADLGGSTIQKKTRASGKLAREIKRAVYRARVALRPQRPA
ncbi:glycosyltransferase family 25 protein [Antarcticimicrobium sediminis]|uniref:Glycosyltransferase family 25 protein n=1 Tax=Antarcticimicrobium sediminis TaxID=2546227 RepID=A0A4V2Z7D1_9RHOB|nr:glycosyltransferase family 25 protein [Antarcticimicrobium sediminis]TDE36016.1 glycosyltransferase family 25 protein [Antarcticimicrobium sediminis]